MSRTHPALLAPYSHLPEPHSASAPDTPPPNRRQPWLALASTHPLSCQTQSGSSAYRRSASAAPPTDHSTAAITVFHPAPSRIEQQETKLKSSARSFAHLRKQQRKATVETKQVIACRP